MRAVSILSTPAQEEVDMQLSRGRSLGVSNLRFVSKPSSLRPITNLSSAAKLDDRQFVQSQMGRAGAKSVNAQLFDLFSVLKFEKVFSVNRFGDHVICDDDVIHAVSESRQHFLYGVQRYTNSVEGLLTDTALRP